MGGNDYVIAAKQDQLCFHHKFGRIRLIPNQRVGMSATERRTFEIESSVLYSFQWFNWYLIHNGWSRYQKLKGGTRAGKPYPGKFLTH